MYHQDIVEDRGRSPTSTAFQVDQTDIVPPPPLLVDSAKNSSRSSKNNMCGPRKSGHLQDPNNNMKPDDNNNMNCKRRKLDSAAASASASASASDANNSIAPDISLRELIPPKDCARIQQRLQVHQGSLGQEILQHHDSKPERSDQHLHQAGHIQSDWSLVIARVKSHPHEAAESFYGPANTTKNSGQSAMGIEDSILTYKPLHAMLKYDPPLDAVEAVLRAHPEAALDVTFEGSALKIACESRVSSMLILRLLLVAEMAITRKLQQQQQKQQQGGKVKSAQATFQESEHAGSSSGAKQAKKQPIVSEPAIHVDPQLSPPDMFSGHNPIRWITERRIPVKTAAMLLKWYPIGAFQRSLCDKDGAPPVDGHFGSMMYNYSLQDMEESPLIDIVDDFARDHYGEDNDDEDYGIGYDYDSVTDSEGGSSELHTYRQRERLRKERRWEKFLHILYATDLALQSTRQKSYAPSEDEESSPPASPKAIKSTSFSSATASITAPNASSSKIDETSSEAMVNPVTTSFHPVHAWIRCITSPSLGLERCRPYGAWSVLRVMGQRIPSEFTVRDTADGNRTALQTLAESSADDCKLCLEEVKDIVECMVDADYRSAFLPRKSDGRLIGHIALENGWPCKDLFSRKKSATCA